MSLSPGVRLGPYEILDPIGAGGMGEVYRARDTKLNRDVAIKILLPAVANDPDRLARFSREAQVLASLNHPNIAAIYGLEEGPAEAGLHVRALVMELVEGPTLDERLRKSEVSSLKSEGSARLPTSDFELQTSNFRLLPGSPSAKRLPSPGRSPRRSKARTSRGSSIAI